MASQTLRLGVGTNVLVRVFVDDGTPQFGAAGLLMRENQIVIAPSVLLETEWVLRDTFRFPRKQVADAFEALLGASNVLVLKGKAVARALSEFRNGCDFADALHLALTEGVEAFVTFDKRFARRAAKLGLQPPVRLLRDSP